jgi:hypothetical protein
MHEQTKQDIFILALVFTSTGVGTIAVISLLAFFGALS